MLGTLPEPARPLIHAATVVASEPLYMPLGLMSDLRTLLAYIGQVVPGARHQNLTLVLELQLQLDTHFYFDWF